MFETTDRKTRPGHESSSLCCIPHKVFVRVQVGFMVVRYMYVDDGMSVGARCSDLLGEEQRVYGCSGKGFSQYSGRLR